MISTTPPNFIKFGLRSADKSIFFWKHRFLNGSKNSNLAPKFLKIFLMIDIHNIKSIGYKDERNLGPKIEFLEPIKNLYFQKKIDFSALFEPILMKFGGVVDIIKIYNKNFFRIFGAKFEVIDQKNWQIRVIFVIIW